MRFDGYYSDANVLSKNLQESERCAAILDQWGFVPPHLIKAIFFGVGDRFAQKEKSGDV